MIEQILENLPQIISEVVNILTLIMVFIIKGKKNKVSKAETIEDIAAEANKIAQAFINKRCKKNKIDSAQVTITTTKNEEKGE